MDSCQRAFRTDDKLRQVETSVAYKFVEVVAADTPLDSRKSAVDFFAVGSNDFCDSSLDAGRLCGVRQTSFR